MRVLDRLVRHAMRMFQHTGPRNDANEDYLYGAKIRIEAWQTSNASNRLHDDEIFVYRFFDGADEKHSDGTLSYQRTFVDGNDGNKLSKPLIWVGPNEAYPDISLLDARDFDLVNGFAPGDGRKPVRSIDSVARLAHDRARRFRDRDDAALSKFFTLFRPVLAHYTARMHTG